MTRSRRRTAVVVVLLLGLAATPAAQAAEPVSAYESAGKKPVRCKAGQVKERVKVRRGRATVRCVAARKAWPAPKPTDMRAAGTSFLLDGNFSKVRDRRGRRAKSLPKLLKRIHPRAERALEGAAKAGLARIDTVAGASQNLGGCGSAGGPSGRVTSTFDAGGGQSVDMTATLGPESSLQLGLENRQGTRRVRIEIEFPGCESHQLDSCPTADGIVRGRDNRRISVRAWVYEGNVETWSQGITLDGETTFRGVVGDDAKLDFMEPHNTEVGTLSLGGSSRGFSPMTMRMLVQRITRVEFPERTYTLGPSTVNVTITSPDLTGPGATATEHEIERGMRTQADQQFSDIVDKGITKFSRAEEHWNGANNCATIQFTPTSGSRTLHIGDTGTVAANLLAQPGGSPSTASWTHTGAGNGRFTPESASSVPASFSYGDIVAAGEGIFVTGSWKAVSKAGVAQATWTQPTEGLVINKIAGTFSGVQNFGGTIFSWAGEVTFVRVFPGQGANGSFHVQSASYTVTASGRAAYFDCTQSGTKTVTQTAGDLTSNGQEPLRLAPYDFTGEVIGTNPFDHSMMVNLSGCSDPHAPGESITSLAFTPLELVGRSADGVDFSGSNSENLGLSNSWTWTLRGTP